MTQSSLMDPIPSSSAGQSLPIYVFRRASNAIVSILGPLIGLALVVAIFGLWKRQEFLKTETLDSVVKSYYYIAICAVGATFVIVTGGIDLSVASTVALSSAVTAMVLRGIDFPVLDPVQAGALAGGMGLLAALAVIGGSLQKGNSFLGALLHGIIGFAVAGIAAFSLIKLVGGRRLPMAMDMAEGLRGVGGGLGLIIAGGIAAGLLALLPGSRRRWPAALNRAGLAAAGTALLLLALWVGVLRRYPDISMILIAACAGISVGAVVGLLNGVMVTAMSLPPFIATLATMGAVRGIALYISKERDIDDVPMAIADKFSQLHHDSSFFMTMPPNVWITVIVVILAIPLLHFTIVGRYAYAIGSNERTARLCGVNVERWKTICYVIAGICAGLAGVMMTASLNGVGQATQFKGAELEVIAAVVIGGTSLFGGEGTIVGSFLGTVILSILTTGCGMADIPASVQKVFVGGTIVLSAALDRFRHLRR